MKTSGLIRKSLKTLIIAGLIFTIEIVFRLIYKHERLEILHAIPFIILVTYTVSFSKSKVLAIAVAAYASLVYFSQMIGFSTYGYWPPPIYYILFLEKPFEAIQSTGGMLQAIIPAAILAAIITVLLGVLYKNRQNKNYILIDLLFLIIFITLPIKNFISDGSRGENPNSRFSAIKAGYYSSSYLLGSYLPNKIKGTEHHYEYYSEELSKGARKPIQNIILIMGESLTYKNMSVFGYARKTTPWLDNEKNNQVTIKKAYASGTYTDVTLPMFFNLIPSPNSDKQIASRRTNLFRFAKSVGFQTHFYSAQQLDGMSLINKVGSEYIDNYRTSFDLGYDLYTSALDEELIPYLEEIDWNKRNFIVLHQRGSHASYSQRVPNDYKPFGSDNLVDEYDNTVAYTDQLLNDILKTVKNKTNNNSWLVVFTSDHGQTVTANTIGHGNLSIKTDYIVPAAVWTNNDSLINIIRTKINSCEIIFHHQLSTLIANSLGADIDISQCDKGYVNGSRIDGSAGYLLIDQSNVNLPKTNAY